MAEYIRGKQYTLVQKRAVSYFIEQGWASRQAFISGWKTISKEGADMKIETAWTESLPDGALLTYTGWQSTGGCDGISCHAFSYLNEEGDQIRGIFNPENWGTIPEGILTPKEEE